jgi:hypothetical protein
MFVAPKNIYKESTLRKKIIIQQYYMSMILVIEKAMEGET